MTRPDGPAWSPRRMAPALLVLLLLDAGCSETGDGGNGTATPPPAEAPTLAPPPVAKGKAAQPGSADYSGKGINGGGGGR